MHHGSQNNAYAHRAGKHPGDSNHSGWGVGDNNGEYYCFELGLGKVSAGGLHARRQSVHTEGGIKRCRCLLEGIDRIVGSPDAGESTAGFSRLTNHPICGSQALA
jgi:hypothetical protein